MEKGEEKEALTGMKIDYNIYNIYRHLLVAEVVPR